jgi:tripartite-type tricarboxylate transporter receptor subunit TctC
MAGRIDIFCDQATNTVPYIRDGRVLAYAVTSAARLEGLSQLPTTAEGGLPALRMGTWHAMYAPRGVPEAVQERIAVAIRAALRTERLRRRFAELVTEPATQEQATPAFHRRFLAEEVARWRPIIQAAGEYAD